MILPGQRMQGNETVSIIIPCYNEEQFIGKCILSLLQQKDMQGRIEIIVVDGMSSDGTRRILNEISSSHHCVKIVDNPNRVTPSALNIGIKNSSGDFICIMGAHSEYDEEYVRNCMRLFLEHPEIACAGGPIVSRGRNSFAKAAALAMSSPVGVGNAKHRFPNYEGYAEMACFPMFKKSVFDSIGYYDENLVKNQDDEFCFRLRLNGGKIYISPLIKSEYYVRENPSGLFNQYFEYGRWRIAVLKKHKLPISFRQFVPVLFFLSTMVMLVTAFILDNIIPAIILPSVYLLILGTYTLYISPKCSIKTMLYFPLSVFILHFSYAAGFAAGIFNFWFKKSK